MLTCLAGSKIINTIDYDSSNIKKWSNSGILKCPVCESKIIFKNGQIRIPHFAHEQDHGCDYGFWENETKEHHLGKELLYKWLNSQDNITNVQLETWIPETKQRPDLMFEIENMKYVIEYQCSPLSIDEFRERRNRYELMGIKDIWVFGTEKHNINKRKVVEEYYYNENKNIYYLNPFDLTFYKRELFDNLIVLYQQSIHDDNLYIENGTIFLNQDVSSEFRKIKHHLYAINKKEEDNEYQIQKELYQEQKSIYDTVMEDIEREKNIRIKAEIDELKRKKEILKTQMKNKEDELLERVRDKFKNKKIYLFSDFDDIKTQRKRFISNKFYSFKKIEDRIAIYHNLLNGDDSDEILILFPYAEFRLLANQKFFRRIFRDSSNVSMVMPERIIHLTIGKGSWNVWDQ